MSNTPALWDHTRRTYEAMAQKAQSEEIEGQAVLVYEGFLSKLVRVDLGIAVPYYGKVLRLLKKMGCIGQLRRGGGNSPSRWVLWKEPAKEEFDAAYRNMRAYRSPTDQRLMSLEQQVVDLRQAQPSIDVSRALASIQQQLDELKETQSG